MKKKKIFLALMTVIIITGCGRRVDKAKISCDLADYLINRTPDDGINQSQSMNIDVTLAEEKQNKDGTLSIPVEASITDLSEYTGKFEVVYEKEEKTAEWKIKTVRYMDRDLWEITPIADINTDTVKKAIVGMDNLIINAAPVKLSDSNVADVTIDNLYMAEDKSNASAKASFRVVDKIVTYKVNADLKFSHTINGYVISESEITDFNVRLNDAYKFTTSDADIINSIKNSVMKVRNTSVDLGNVTGIKKREEHFNPDDLSMTIIADVNISNMFYDASAKVYNIYRLNDNQEYWQLDRIMGDNFMVKEWKDMKGLYTGKLGATPLQCDILAIKGDGTFTALFIYEDDTEMEIWGKIEPSTMDVSIMETDGSFKLEGAFSADMGIFKGRYGNNSTWYLINEDVHRAYIEKKQNTSP